MAAILRDYQQKAVDSLRDSYRSGKQRPLLALPTGGGKTFVFCFIAQSAAAKGSRVLILVHRVELLRQASRSLENLGVPHGLIAPGNTPTRDAVQVASVQTLGRRLAAMDWEPDLIVIDEAHHAIAGTWAKVLAHWPRARILGVTATPRRLDGRGLGDVFDDLVIGPSLAELISQGHLSPYKYFAPPIALDLSGVRTRMGDFARDEVAERVDKPSIMGDVVGHYRKICPGAPAIAFCASVKHATHTAEAFRAAGFLSTCLDGTMADADRAKAIDDLGAGRLHVLTSCDIISEGTDIPVVTAAILLRPTQSESLCLQQVGRVLRRAPGKDFAIILDHVGSVQRHGLPDDERDWSLAGRAKKRRQEVEPELTIRQCPACFAAHRPAPVCPLCGFKYEIKAREIENVKGELQAVDIEALRKARQQQVGKARTLDDLIAIEKARGYKPGWSHHIWRSRQGKRATA